ncbi:hypothetical protein BO94DRAFT_611252 [Aspergillus sclerotioniger CBS 115572]|uniref:Uncharacterized protein n=1 Tax=Aspergillus sclerotioniger CBS 115572 TaxID=1450535 RepID=A0A317V6T7_9EURO|nr:hypothetical protein BO94DRAFT_611252 [Aspergillus sclerotioniger CBS 115572]PWY68971.1 hypothetical protein BO94DRAFT_611252 [Aspergillus sclerotioniger CBS 115572]
MSERININDYWACRWQQYFPISSGYRFECDPITRNDISLEIITVTRPQRNRITLVMIVGDSRDEAHTPTYNVCLDERVTHYGFTIRDGQLRTFHRPGPTQRVEPWGGEFQEIMDHDQPSDAISRHLEGILSEFRSNGGSASPGLENDPTPGPRQYSAFLNHPWTDDAPTPSMLPSIERHIEDGGSNGVARNSNVRTRDGRRNPPSLQRSEQSLTANAATNVGHHATNGVSTRRRPRAPPPPDSETDDDMVSG